MTETIMVNKLSKDVLKASAELGDQEARFLVDTYYALQKDRIQYMNQDRSVSGTNEPSVLTQWLAEQSLVLENQVKRVLDKYSMNQPIGKWMRSITGIGPVISAGFLAHIDIKKAPTTGHIWNYAGLNPDTKWEKGQKRPWNAKLKTLCWKLGESFVKVSGREDSLYGNIYKKQKEYYAEKNENGEYADQASEAIKRYSKSTESYKYLLEGKLPPAQIHARAKRYAVKMFLSHMHEIWYELHHKEKPPKPYAIAILHHGHYIPAPNREIVGLE